MREQREVQASNLNVILKDNKCTFREIIENWCALSKNCNIIDPRKVE